MERKLDVRCDNSLTTKPAHGGLGRLEILEVDAVVADQRIGHGDDLAGVGGIGEDLLISGHRGVENDLALTGAGAAEDTACQDRAILEGEFGDFGIHRKRSLHNV